VLFWLVLLLGGEILALYPELVDHVSFLWGNLVPVSWISFVGIISLIFYLLFQTIRFNELQVSLTDLARNSAFQEKRIRELEKAKKI